MSQSLTHILPKDNDLVPFRQKALSVFKKIGLPVKTDEVWRNAASILDEDIFASAKNTYYQTIAPTLLSHQESYKIIFVNGFYAAHLSDDLPEGVNFISLSQAIATQSPLLQNFDKIEAPYSQGLKALNSVMSQDGIILSVGDNIILQKPLHFIFKNIEEGTTAYGRILCNIGKNTQIKILQENDTIDNQYENHVTECFIGDNASLHYLKSICDYREHKNYHSFSASMGRDSRLNLAYFHMGGGNTRHETNIFLNGQGGSANIGGASYLQKQAKIDHTSCLIHNVPHCYSSQNFQSIGDDHTKSMVQSKSIVQKDAQKTDAHQILRAYLLSDMAGAFAKPELEIYADDVKCSHGSTIGRLDEKSIYYMRARGIPLLQAQALLTRASIQEVLDIFASDDISQILLNHFSNGLTRS